MPAPTPAAHVLERFQAVFHDSPEIITSAPGRVNLIGEHTDYSGGLVMPCAIERRTYVAASRADEMSHVYSTEREEYSPFRAGELQPSRKQNAWTDYVAGVAWALQEAGHPVGDIRAMVSSDVPLGGGLSSSAALEMAVLAAYAELYGLRLPVPDWPSIGRRAENEYVGAPTGIMDQTASARAQPGHAMLLDTRSGEVRHVRIPADLTLAVLDTGVRHSHGAGRSPYAVRREEIAEAERGVGSLREATLRDLEEAGLPENVFRRARHVVTENARVERFAEALDREELREVGDLMREAHASIRDDFEASSPELDGMVEAAWAAPGVVGARMTGGGFGGACVALVRRDEAEAALDRILARYRERFEGGSALLTAPAAGVRIESSELRAAIGNGGVGR